MAQPKKHVKRFDSEHLSGTITIIGDEVTIEFEYTESYWGTIFLIVPWKKKYKAKRTVVRSRTNANYRDYDRYARHGELDPVLINVLNELTVESFEEFDAIYPEVDEVINQHVELDADEVADTIENIVTGNTIEDAVAQAEAYVESKEDVIADVLAETDREIEAAVEADLTDRDHGNGGYVSPEPVYVAPVSAPEPAYEPPVYSSPSPSPSYDSSPSPSYSSPSPSYSSPSPSYDSGSSYSSSSSDSGGGGGCD
ncbi:MAG: hypothetical protein JXR12_05650 [Neptunomonas phycophila]|uniref:hypothetical protein n=1 Tax=Neptunomonas phycophila TaxID=1572645 RepID=UPI003B8CEDBE